MKHTPAAVVPVCAILLSLASPVRAGWEPPAEEPAVAPAWARPSATAIDAGESREGDDEAAQRPVSLGLRAALGTGGGTSGFSFGATLDLDVWVVGPLGFGARGGVAYSADVFASSNLVFGEPLVLLKLGSESTYLRLGAGIGFARTHSEVLEICIAAPCGTPPRTTSSAVASLTAAVLWHPGSVELGPTFSFDVADEQVYFLAGFTIGGAVRSGS